MPETLGALGDLLSRPPTALKARARLQVDGSAGNTVHVLGPTTAVLRLMLDVGPSGDFALSRRARLRGAWSAGLELHNIDVELRANQLRTGGEVARWTLRLDSETTSSTTVELSLTVDGDSVAPLVLHVDAGRADIVEEALHSPRLAVDLASTAPYELIKLVVGEGSTTGRLSVLATCPGHDPGNLDIPCPSGVFVTPDDLDAAKTFVSGIQTWSERSGALVRWLRTALDGKTDPVVLIDDSLPSGTPFELLDLETWQRSLGSAARVVRWNAVETMDGPLAFELERPEERGGALVQVEASVDPGGEERSAAAALGGVSPGGLEDLLDVVATADPPVVLIHVASHATWSVDEAHRRGLSGTGDDAELSEVDFAWVDAPLAPAAVFANACHSGRLALDDSAELTGLPLSFLRDHAWLFAGTLGRVSGDIASEIGRRFLTEAGSPEGVDPAAFLRDLRALWLRELADVRRDRSKRAQAARRYLHAGLYVVYGPARARIKVERTDG